MQASSGSEVRSERRKFEFDVCLGRGGFGEVYRAGMTSPGGVRTDVAVKVLHTDLNPESQALARLRDEALVLGLLNHPNIVKIYDLVTLGGHPTLVAEYIDGMDLDKCVEAKITPRAVIEVIGHVADALQAAWSTPAPGGEGPLQILHRDVKPSNIRISRHGVVKLLDFGIARATHVDRQANTIAGTLLGSTIYMAPERLDKDEFTLATDVFALGCTLFEALSGKRLFGQLPQEQQFGIIYDEADYNRIIQDRFSALPSGLPPAALSLLRHMVGYKAEQRPSATVVARRCDKLVDQMKGQTLKQWCRKLDWPPLPRLSGTMEGVTLFEGSTSQSLSATLERMAARVDRDPPSVPSGTMRRSGGALRWVVALLGFTVLASIVALCVAIAVIAVVMLV